MCRYFKIFGVQVLALAVGMVPLMSGTAHADRVPAACTGTSINVGIFRTTPTGTGYVNFGDTVHYDVTISNTPLASDTDPGACLETDVTVTGICPGPDGHWETGTSTPLVTGATYPSGFPQTTVGSFDCVITGAYPLGPVLKATARAEANGTAHSLENGFDVGSGQQEVSVTVTTPHIINTKECTGATCPDPITFSGTVTNDGDENLVNVVCTDSETGVVFGPAPLAVNETQSYSGNYTPASPGTYTDTITCTGTSENTQQTVTSEDSAICDWDCPPPHISNTKECVDGNCVDPITFSGAVTNDGGQDLVDVTCTDSETGVVFGPAPLAVNETQSYSGNYSPAVNVLSTNIITCTGTSVLTQQTVTSEDSATCERPCQASIDNNKDCQDGVCVDGQENPITFSGSVTNTGQDALVDVTCTDSETGVVFGPGATLDPGETQPYSGNYTPATPGSYTDTITCTGTGVATQAAVTSEDSATCSWEECRVEVGCRMTGGKNNFVGDIDAQHGSPGSVGPYYTTGGQIGAPGSNGCIEVPPKGQCKPNEDHTGTVCIGGPNDGMTDCSDSNPCGSYDKTTAPWGEWEHVHHAGPDDPAADNNDQPHITGGSFAFHAGSHSAPDEAYIQQITCTDPGWCVQARPAPMKQIYWEGLGIFQALKGAKGQDDPTPDFPCPVHVYGSNGSVKKEKALELHYYTAHVADFGEPAGAFQKPVSECPVQGGFGGNPWSFGGGIETAPACGQLEGDLELTPAQKPDSDKFGDKFDNSICTPQECLETSDDGGDYTGCPDWYDITIYCGEDANSGVAYHVGHYIDEGNYQLHPNVGDSCNPGDDGGDGFLPTSMTFKGS